MRRIPPAALVGAAAWVLLVVARLLGLVHLGLIDLLLLFAPLVVVPLGVSLTGLDGGPAAALRRAALILQPVGATGVVASMLLPAGVGAGLLAALWLLVCGLLAMAGLAAFIQERPTLPRLARSAALGYLAVGGAWLVLFRLGVPVLTFPRVIIELTAVHFHFAGFGATLISALTAAWLRRRRPRWARLGEASLILVVLGSPLTAAGFTSGLRPVQALGAAVIATGVVLTAGLLLLAVAPRLTGRLACWALRLAAIAPALPMVLALDWSGGPLFGIKTLSIEGMAVVHGILNAFGFTLLGLIGWALSEEGRIAEDSWVE
jgi:hypothetical protein